MINTSSLDRRFNKEFENLNGISIGYFIKNPKYESFEESETEGYQYVEDNKMWLVMLDGEYADKMTVIMFYKKFELIMEDNGEGSYKSSPATYTKQFAAMRHLDKFTEESYRICHFDFTIDYDMIPENGFSNSSHVVTVRNSIYEADTSGFNAHQKRLFSSYCLPDNVAIKIKVDYR